MIFLQLALCADSFFGLVFCDVSTCGMSSSLFILAHVCCSVVLLCGLHKTCIVPTSMGASVVSQVPHHDQRTS